MGLRGCNWSSLNFPGYQTTQSHLFLKLGLGIFSFFTISISFPIVRWHKWKIVKSEMSLGATNDPVWMTKALQTPSSLPLILTWRIVRPAFKIGRHECLKKRCGVKFSQISGFEKCKKNLAFIRSLKSRVAFYTLKWETKYKAWQKGGPWVAWGYTPRPVGVKRR